MLPLWLLLLGPLYLDSNTMIPFIDIAAFSLIPIIPILIGIGFKKCTSTSARKKAIEFAVSYVRPFSVVLHLFCIAYTATLHFYLLWDFMKEWKDSIAAVCLPWFAGVLSCAVASVLQLSVVQAKTIALEMFSVNTALATVLLKNTLPQPEADLSSVIPLISFIFSQLPLFFIGLYSFIKHLWLTQNPDRSKTMIDTEHHDIKNANDEQHEMQTLNDVVG